jgi:general stress protein 26
MDTAQIETPRNEQIAKLADLIKGIKIAMLVTVEPDTTLRSRPMATQELEFDGDLWFFTADDSPKSGSIQWDRQVNVVFSDPGHMRFISASGEATLVKDRAKIQELWRPSYEMWFKDGLNDPSISLIKVEVSEAEYWDSPTSLVVKLVGLLRPKGEPVQMLGEHQKIKLM